ncbi:MAG: dihydroneopterin aldolase [Gemmatimonadaceae bacterium]|nr:dihydroneopterin aldolase [Gemmatimonadaceae bacterium]
MHDVGPVIEEVSLRGLEFNTCVGILPEERVRPQRLLADITVWRRPVAPGRDVLDYRRLHALVASHVDTNAVEYLETAAHAIASAALDEASTVRVRVVLRKPEVMLPHPLEAAEVVADHARRG